MYPVERRNPVFEKGHMWSMQQPYVIQLKDGDMSQQMVHPTATSQEIHFKYRKKPFGNLEECVIKPPEPRSMADVTSWRDPDRPQQDIRRRERRVKEVAHFAGQNKAPNKVRSGPPTQTQTQTHGANRLQPNVSDITKSPNSNKTSIEVKDGELEVGALKRGHSRKSKKRRRRGSAMNGDRRFSFLENDEEDILKMYEEDGEDEPSTEEDLLEQISEQKDLIEHVKCQPWTMAKKMKILKLAKGFVEKHEGRLSKSKGYQQKGKQIFRQLKRTWSNLVTSLVPWEMKIKRIESHFGSVVVSYFVFLRWLIWVNVILTLMTTCFIVVPELIAGEPHGSNSRKTVPDDELDTAADLKTIWNAGYNASISVVLRVLW
ncbi:transmembrane channel-like protein 3 [Patella vulgata]|uniref:transmembrane channel-like protein 3 n=1 Tax=Patella vulgata TaxID=6465 RepID=UPI00217F8D7F|nr:transmembrane channel-like protein 3 [Patella vulgata]